MPNFTLPDSVFIDACKAYSTPFHLYDEQGIRSTAGAGSGRFPGARISRSISQSKRCPLPPFCAF